MAIYSKMVQGQGDLVGHIAYSVYRDELIEYIEKYKTKHRVENIPAEKLSQYKEFIENDSIIKKYRDRGNDILKVSLQGYFAEIFKKEPWWKRIFFGSIQSMCGAILLSFFIWLFATIGQYKIGDISIEIKHNGKQAQQEQVVQSKQIDHIKQ